MSRPFAKNDGKTTFAQIKKSSNAGDYITNKKVKNMFCSTNYCIPRQNIYSYNNYLLLKRGSNLFNKPYDYINKTELYINLLTKLDLKDVLVISDLSSNQQPVIIEKTTEPYLKYNIDPSGNLFGDTVCGINNFENYIVFNQPSNL